MVQRPTHPTTTFSRVALLFSGGPAPAANAVISAAAVSFLRNGVGVIGCRHGYQRLLEFSADRPLIEGEDYLLLNHDALRRSRSRQGILLGTARANPGKQVRRIEDLDDPVRSRPLRTVYEALRSLDVEALISIGGDDTLKTANLFRAFQDRLPADQPRIRVVHVPKTIDNDYNGIDFTFGYFTAVETLATELRNLAYDAEATHAYFIAETMGRSAGWLAYGAAIAGEASMVIGVEDIIGDLHAIETVADPEGGGLHEHPVMEFERVVEHIVDKMVAREREGKPYGVVVLAEGLAGMLPQDALKDVPRDDHGHIRIGSLNTAQLFEDKVATAYEARTGRAKKVRGVQFGYEARCASPHAFDVVLGSQLGVGAYRALAEKGLDRVMVSTRGQLELSYVPFDQLIDSDTMRPRVRMVEPGSDFHLLARFLEQYD